MWPHNWETRKTRGAEAAIRGLKEWYEPTQLAPTFQAP